MEDAVQDLLRYKTLAVGIWLLLLFALERAIPAAMAPAGDGRWGWRRLMRNAGLWLVNLGVSLLVVIPVPA